jgi:multisubunit Na+/H+ antiporter MnhG subunit
MIAILVLFTNPVGSASIARASLLAGVRPWRVDRDSARQLQSADGGDA